MYLVLSCLAYFQQTLGLFLGDDFVTWIKACYISKVKSEVLEECNWLKRSLSGIPSARIGAVQKELCTSCQDQVVLKSPHQMFMDFALLG